MKRFTYTSAGNTRDFTNHLLIGKEILSVRKDGIGYSPIITTVDDPVNKQVRYHDYSGSFTFPQTFETGEETVILYQDIISAES